MSKNDDVHMEKSRTPIKVANIQIWMKKYLKIFLEAIEGCIKNAERKLFCFYFQVGLKPTFFFK